LLNVADLTEAYKLKENDQDIAVEYIFLRKKEQRVFDHVCLLTKYVIF